MNLNLTSSCRFDLIKKFFYATWPQRFNEFLFRVFPKKDYVVYGPRHLLIEVTTRCNFNCGFCIRNQPSLFSSGSYDFPIDLYERVISRFWSAFSVGFAGLGEPTLHPQLVKMIYYAKSHHKKTSVITNGSMLHDCGIDLIEAGLDKLCISLKVLSDDQFSRITGRKKDIFDRIINNISFILEEAIRRRSSIRIFIAFVVFRSRIDDIPEAIRISKELGIRQLVFQSLIPFEDSHFDQSEALFQEDDETASRLSYYRSFYENYPGIEIIWPKLLSKDPINFHRLCCWYWNSLRIDVNGFVNSCGRVYLPRQEYGHVLDPKVFNAPHFREWRRYFLNDSIPLPTACRFCVENFLNRI